MAKREYNRPSIKTLLINPMSMIAESGKTGASGGNVPWGVKRKATFDDDYDEESKY